MNTAYDARLLAQETAAAAIRANIRDVQLDEARAATTEAVRALRSAELQQSWHGERLAHSRARVGEAFDKFDVAADGVRASLVALSETTVEERRTIEDATASVVRQFEVLAESLAEMARKKLEDAAEEARILVREESDDARALLITEHEIDMQRS